MHEIGRVLQEGRTDRGLDINEIAHRTFINVRYLKALESGEFHKVPGGFAKGYLKIYADVLALDTKALLALYDQTKNTPSGSLKAAAV